MFDRIRSRLGRAVMLAGEEIRDRRANPSPRWRVAINRRPIGGPWGGGNQWLRQLVPALRRAGFSVRYTLDRPVDAIVLADPRRSPATTFGPDEIRSYKRRHPSAVCIHRINENDQRKATNVIDRSLADANDLADVTVFISAWLRDYHTQRWFDRSRPHQVILNGADPRVFYPDGPGSTPPGSDAVVRLVTHHWSDHRMKGFDVYQQIDALIAGGALPDAELWIIGRWPAQMRWRAAKTFGPTHGRRLAELLRRCDVYVTGSRWEPGGMHVAEAAQCGLPVLYHADGGGIAELVDGFGIAFRDDVRSAIEEARARDAQLRRAVRRSAPSGERMCDAYRRLIEQLMITRRPAEQLLVGRPVCP